VPSLRPSGPQLIRLPTSSQLLVFEERDLLVLPTVGDRSLPLMPRTRPLPQTRLKCMRHPRLRAHQCRKGNFASRLRSGDHDRAGGHRLLLCRDAVRDARPFGGYGGCAQVSISPFPLVRKGDQNHPVKTLQYLLRARDHTVTVDGIFGPKTDAAVRAFQQQKGLAVDGIVGPNTWSG
jgi:hypothetical protein